MAIIAQGQITIIDYSDAVSLNCYIGSNQPLTQIYTQDNLSYVPDWSTGTFLKLTPQLYKSGSGTDVMESGTGVKKVTWSSNGTEIASWTTPGPVSGGDAGHVMKSTAPWDLTVKVNDLSSASQKNYECTIVWIDSVTLLEITTKAAISFSKINNPGSLIIAICYAPNGTVFKNGAVTSLKAHCDFWRGASIDTGDVEYRWFKNDPNVDSTGHANYHANGGLGWGLISETNLYGGVSGYSTNEITIPDTTVLNSATFKCAITDVDASSTTYNRVVFDTISFADQSDPFQVVIDASAGTVLKNGVGSTALTAVLWRAAEIIDSGGVTYTYTWTKLDGSVNAVPVNFFGTSSPNKIGKSITVDGNDVDGKNVFTVEISI